MSVLLGLWLSLYPNPRTFICFSEIARRAPAARGAPFSFYENPVILNPKLTYLVHGKYQGICGGGRVGTCSIRIAEQEKGHMAHI